MRKIDSGKKILVHCRYGIGRTGTAALAYLFHHGINFKKAQAMMEHTPSSPSTNAQKKLVDSYIAKLQGVIGHDFLQEESPKSFGRLFRRIKAAIKWDD